MVGQTFGHYSVNPLEGWMVNEDNGEISLIELKDARVVHHFYKILRVEPADDSSATTATLSTPPMKSKKDIPTIAKAANPAVVMVVMANNDRPIATGTGFVAMSDGVIVTNYHVIETGNVAVVKFSDGTVLPVDGILAADKVRDPAIIKIHGKNFRALTLGNSDRVQIGEEIVAIGNPLGLELTVSNGILSGVRTVEKKGGKLLQVTAPISHGSSGGPLFNMTGEVVGITAMYVEGGENLNFAIPVNDAKLLLQKRSAKLRELPNEADTEESPKETDAEATPSQKQTCNERAAKFVRYKRAEYGPDEPRIDIVSHYDPKSGTCYVESGFYFVEGKIYPSGRDYGAGFIHIDNAFSEGTGTKSYGFFGFGSGWTGPSCRIVPPDGSGREIICRSKEEFDDLTLKYFGITRPLPDANTR